MEMCMAQLNLAALPEPSAWPAVPLPARVVTAPELTITFRTLWVVMTSTTRPSAEMATPYGFVN
jgi:hypothetical protein